MNVGFSGVLKNISYSFLANLVTLLVAVIMTLIAPKFLSVYEYGLWQLFLFYYYYVGFFHFGWEDGIYLRYAGKPFNNLPRQTMAGQFRGIVLLQLCLAMILWFAFPVFVRDPDKLQILRFTALLIPFLNFNNLCNFIMQISNRIKDYARMLFLEQIVFLSLSLLFLVVLSHRNFLSLYFARVIAVLSVVFIGGWFCRGFLHPPFPATKDFLQETRLNIAAGSKLMLANVAGMLIIGIVRYGISVGWDVATFGKISLTLNISNFLLVFINAVSIVLFPLLKQTEELSHLYTDMHKGLSVILMSLLLAYYPLKAGLSWWLPRYADSLAYMALLLPVCLFESRMQLLCNTYLKSLRQETVLLKINCVMVLLSIAVTIITVSVYHQITMAVFSITVLYTVRCMLAEYWLRRILAVQWNWDAVQEVLLVVLFVMSGWYLDSWYCMLLYLVGYLWYLYIGREKNRNLFRKFAGLLSHDVKNKMTKRKIECWKDKKL